MTLRYEEVATPPFQFAHAAARETTDTLALLVVDIVPVLRLLDIRYLLPLRLNRHRQQQKQDGKQFPHITHFGAKVNNFCE